MSRFKWLWGAALGLIVLAAIGVCVFLFLNYKEEQARSRQDTEPQQTLAASEQAKDACREFRRLVDFDNCLAEQAEAERVDQRERYDLKAQQDMALWALGLFLSGLLGLVITGAGVVYVALTLKATRHALKAANRSADAAETVIEDTRKSAQIQLRAYVHIDDTQGPDMNAGPPYRFSYKIKNAGQRWSRLSEQIFRIDKWSVCRG